MQQKQSIFIKYPVLEIDYNKCPYMVTGWPDLAINY